MIARHLIIHGRVQGVFYRDWTVETARRLGLTGWVRNRRDGTVEAVVQGEDEAVERFIEMAKDGPPRAGVKHIDAAPLPAGGFSHFEKQATA
ncbi:acylphosphatase [Parasphingopyxis marina]|uniref:acylphosphatase n=1 Tax=Parasphingopyxis marina TaxID=2761622 RepID=A0A842HY83_9SPHN|nr:acylphosphatase [Parasphingopyxis marina]MBC2777805.1 acylphosphatase [Parasphingopyxis marina]